MVKSLITSILFANSFLAISQVYDVEGGVQYDGIHPKMLYVFDGLKLRRSSDIVVLKLGEENLLKSDTLSPQEAISRYSSLGKNGAILLFSDYPVIVNDEVFLSENDKVLKLNSISSNQIVKLEHISKRKLLKIYGIKTTGGGVKIITK